MKTITLIFSAFVLLMSSQAHALRADRVWTPADLGVVVSIPDAWMLGTYLYSSSPHIKFNLKPGPDGGTRIPPSLEVEKLVGDNRPRSREEFVLGLTDESRELIDGPRELQIGGFPATEFVVKTPVRFFTGTLPNIHVWVKYIVVIEAEQEWFTCSMTMMEERYPAYVQTGKKFCSSIRFEGATTF